METKVCTKCGLDQPLSEYYRDGDRLRSECKTCTKDKVKERQGERVARAKEKRHQMAEAGVYLDLAEKWCPRRGHMVPIDGFHNDRGSVDGKQNWCKECQGRQQHATKDGRAAYIREWRARDPEKRRYVDREGHLKRKYKMTHADFDGMLALQDGRCAACGTTEPGGKNWHVDHDHVCCPEKESCGKCVVGILCFRCNTTAGRYDDDAESLIGLAEYITRTRKLIPEMEQEIG